MILRNQLPMEGVDIQAGRPEGASKASIRVLDARKRFCLTGMPMESPVMGLSGYSFASRPFKYKGDEHESVMLFYLDLEDDASNARLVVQTNKYFAPDRETVTCIDGSDYTFLDWQEEKRDRKIWKKQ